MNQPTKNSARMGVLLAALVLSTLASGQTTRDGFVEALPTFASGPHARKHAVYQHEKFSAWFDAKGVLRVQPLDKGKPVGRAFTCLAVEPFYVDKSGTYWARAPKRFLDPSAPSVIPSGGGKIRLKGRLDENIPFTAEFTFSGNTIKASGGCQDNPATTPPTRFRLMARFSPTHSFTNTPPAAQIEAATKGMTLEVRPKTDPNSPTVYPYAAKILNLAGPYASMIVRGAFGPRVVTFKPVGREGILYGYIYSGYSPWQGFCVQYITQGKKINLTQNESLMTIE